MSTHDEGSAILTVIAQELAKARERWPQRRLYLVLGTPQMRQLEEAFKTLCAGACACVPPGGLASIEGISIIETKWWKGIRAVPESDLSQGLSLLFHKQERDRQRQEMREGIRELRKAMGGGGEDGDSTDRH